MASIQKVSRLERKYNSLQKKQNEVLKRIQEEKRQLKRQIENERYNYILQTVKRLDLPVNNPAIIIGSLITAKKIIENNNIKEINHYIDLYSKIVKETEQIELPPEEIEVEKDIMKEIAAEKVEGA